MRSFFKWLLLLPVAIIVIAFAVANRHVVEVVFDPSGLVAPGLTITAPLFIILFLAAMVGVVLGGAATWFSQGRYRKAARQAQAEVQQVKAENEHVREEAERVRAQFAALPPPRARDAA